MIERGKTANPPKHQISLYWPEVKWIKTIFFPYSSLLGPGGTILQDELSALQNYLSSGYNKRWVPARTPDMSTSHPCRGVGISTSGLVPFCQDWKQNTPEHHQGSIPKALVSSQISGMSNQQSWDSRSWEAQQWRGFWRNETISRAGPKAPRQPLAVTGGEDETLCRFPQGAVPCGSPQVPKVRLVLFFWVLGAQGKHNFQLTAPDKG